MKDLTMIIEAIEIFSVSRHLFADDMQLAKNTCIEDNHVTFLNVNDRFSSSSNDIRLSTLGSAA